MKPKYKPILIPFILLAFILIIFFTIFQQIDIFSSITYEFLILLFGFLIYSERFFNVLKKIVHSVIRPKRSLKRFKLGWSEEWSKKKVRNKVLSKLKLASIDDLYEFLDDPLEGTFFRNSFFQI